MDGSIETNIQKLADDVGNFRHRMHEEQIHATVADAVAKFRARFNAEAIGDGLVNVAPQTVVEEYESAYRVRYDATLREDAARLDQQMRDAEQAITKVLDVVSRLPDPFGAAEAIGNGTEREISLLRLDLEVDRFERRWATKTYAQMEAAYRAADDTRDARFAWWVERHHDTKWRDLSLSDDPADLMASDRLRRAIAERRQTRLTSHHANILAAQQKLTEIKSNAVTSTLFKHVRSGRGLAVVSR